ncbi:MAG: hypothetical protein ACI8TP_005230, partial [Acidimicrobiales bacterium]
FLAWPSGLLVVGVFESTNTSETTKFPKPPNTSPNSVSAH